jgi:hypothetical protein
MTRAFSNTLGSDKKGTKVYRECFHMKLVSPMSEGRESRPMSPMSERGEPRPWSPMSEGGEP